MNTRKAFGNMIFTMIGIFTLLALGYIVQETRHKKPVPQKNGLVYASLSGRIDVVKDDLPAGTYVVTKVTDKGPVFPQIQTIRAIVYEMAIEGVEITVHDVIKNRKPIPVGGQLSISELNKEKIANQ